MENILVPVLDSISTVASSIAQWLSSNFAVLVFIVFIVVVAVVLTRATGTLFSKLLTKIIREDLFPSKTDRDRRVRTLSSIATAISNFIIWTVALLTILNNVGVNTAPLLASAGIIGVALGFGAQSLVRDFMTGLFIIAENQYRVGDHVEIQNIKGTVVAVTMRTTVVKDDNGSVFHIPNGSIIVTGNHTMGNNTIHAELSVATDTDLDLLQKIVNEVGAAQAKTIVGKETITKPIHFLRIKTIANGSVVFRIIGKVRAGKQAEVQSDYLLRLQKALLKNNITLK